MPSAAVCIMSANSADSHQAAVSGPCKQIDSSVKLNLYSQEKKQIISILKNYSWSPVNLTYDGVSCNLDHDNVTIFLLSTPVRCSTVLASSLLWARSNHLYIGSTR